MYWLLLFWFQDVGLVKEEVCGCLCGLLGCSMPYGCYPLDSCSYYRCSCLYCSSHETMLSDFYPVNVPASSWFQQEQLVVQNEEWSKNKLMFNHLLSVQRINVRLLLPSELQGTSVLDWPEQTSEGEGGRRKELWGGHWPSFLHSIPRVIENCQCGFFSEQHKAVLAFTGIQPGNIGLQEGM